jgi:hypothetical protein
MAEHQLDDADSTPFASSSIRTAAAMLSSSRQTRSGQDAMLLDGRIGKTTSA